MKVLDIAWKDLLRSFRSAFGVVMMFVTPLVVTAIFFFAFGNLGGVGTTASNLTPFVIQVGPGVVCGQTIDLVVLMNSSAGAAQIPFELMTGVPVESPLLDEDFEGVTAPTLPAGWSTSTFAGASNPWVTSTVYSSSGFNSVFCADISTTSGNRLTSPSIAVPPSCDLVDVKFDITHDIEDNFERKAWDGALLKIEINDGSITTKLAGAFASLFDPFYPWQIERSSSSVQPLQDLSCWSSDVTPNFSQVHLQFPGLAGTTIKLLFDMGTDSNTGTSTGMFIDNISVRSIEKGCGCTDPPMVTVVPPSVDFNPVPVTQTECDTVYIINDGPTPLIITGISGCTDAPFSLDTTMTDHAVAVGDTATLVVCVTPDSAGPFNCAIDVSSNAANGPISIPVTLDVVTAVGGGAAPMPFRIVSVAPNPFNPSTTIRFSLPQRMPVTAEVWSVTGAKVKVLAKDQQFTAGENELRWNGRNDFGEPVASGVYFVRVSTELGEKVTRAVLLK